MKLLTYLFLFCRAVGAVELVPERGAEGACQEFVARHELKVFKDPTLFIPNLGLIQIDPKVGWYRLMQETPLLTVLSGRVSLMRLGEAREFKNFGAIARLYELAEPRLRLVDPATSLQKTPVKIVPVQVCGSGALGFVLESDLKQAKENREASVGLPPSVYPNPIPEWKAKN
jgi:hypothetical protein